MYDLSLIYASNLLKNVLFPKQCIQEDSVTTPKPSAFKRAIKKFMNFSDFDTLYISPNRYNYALMAINADRPS